MRKIVELTCQVEVELDETKFTPAFMGEFRQHFFPFDTLEDHFGHIAQLEAREVLNEGFTEGYGPLKDMGIKAKVIWQDQPTVFDPESKTA